ncbi:hypothetical protein HBH61_171270 [Parastagonospora nodorum]|nr:hypothetical protein HBI03_191620 [Parastagonospora nodorum]KAH4804646.1 hypothetical protein HBH61_171270 [Parastagonospora nodorum]KAH5680136.1 hypothetical protein HBI21_065450 [Parastagonospora nodorum]
MSLSLFSALISVAHATSTCYYPNGVASHGGACGSNSEDSACCGPSFVCLSNGLCAVGPESRRPYAYEYYRSSSQYDLGGGHGVQSCGNNIYCCAANYDCCTNFTSIFNLGVADIVTTIQAMGDIKTSLTAVPNSTLFARATSTTTTKEESKQGASNAVAIGVSIGIGMGAVFAFVLALMFILYKRRKRITASDIIESKNTPELEARRPPKLLELNLFEGKLSWALRAKD